MGNLFCCLQKNKKNYNNNPIISGRYCFKCNKIFETKSEYNLHKNYCEPRLRGDL